SDFVPASASHSFSRNSSSCAFLERRRQAGSAMLDGLVSLGHAYLALLLSPTSLALGMAGALTGILVGCMPGLSATLCIALLTTLTVKLPANDAILILVCSYVGTLYGGSRSAILLNIPGTAANAASCADGHALALRGEAGRAIGIATSGAFCGTFFGVVCLATLTPMLANVALSFGAQEFFWLALFGVTMSGTLVGNDPLKGWLMGALGLFVALSFGAQEFFWLALFGVTMSGTLVGND